MPKQSVVSPALPHHAATIFSAFFDKLHSASDTVVVVVDSESQSQSHLQCNSQERSSCCRCNCFAYGRTSGQHCGKRGVRGEGWEGSVELRLDGRKKLQSWQYTSHDRAKASNTHTAVEAGVWIEERGQEGNAWHGRAGSELPTATAT